MPNQAVGFGALLAGGILVTAAITGASLPDVATGKSGQPTNLGGNDAGASGEGDASASTSSSSETATGNHASPMKVLGKIIGLPFQGTHAKAFNVQGGSDNWQSENAVDIATPIGTPIYAVQAGTIGSNIGSLGIGGRFAGLRLTVQNATNAFYYQHLSQIVVRAGQQVQAGDLLGYSGEANGVAHLHFAVQNGNPQSYL